MTTLATIARMTLVVGIGLLATNCSEPTGPGAVGPLPTLTQTQIDIHTAINIINATVDIYNQNVAGRAQSEYNQWTLGCPNGGTVLIQGLASRATNSNLNTLDLTYTMTNCREVKSQWDFTYSGVITEKGSFDTSTNFLSLTVRSTGSVTMNGTIEVPDYQVATVNQTVSLTINRGSSGTSGDIAGRTFSYTN